MIYLVTNREELFDNEYYKIISVKESLELLDTLFIVGVDTETEGLDCYTKRLLSLQLGNYDNQVVIDCTAIDVTLYKDYLESDRLFLFWNAKFDLKFLFRHNIVPKNIYDGYLAEKLMYLGYPAGMHSMSLKSAGIKYLNIELDKSIRGQIINKGLSSDVIVYAACDVKYLEKIKDEQHKILAEKQLLTAIQYENKFVLPLAYCEYCGIKLDVDKWKEKMKKDKEKENYYLKECNSWLINLLYNKELTPALASIKKRYTFVADHADLFDGWDRTPKCLVNWSSSKQVIDVFNALGIDLKTLDKATRKYKDSVDSKILSPQKDKCELIPLYLKYKEAAKVTSTYGQNFLDQINPISHRIHTNYTQLGADTTRITSGGKDKYGGVEYINLLNLPSDAFTRSCFIAERGNKWISIDYSG